jgi:hypothetical protein
MKESVKGFCRRQSQKVGQNYGKSEKTRDADVDGLVGKYETMKTVNEKLAVAFSIFLKNVAATTESLKEVRAALTIAQATEKDAFVDEGRQLDIAYAEINAKVASMEKALQAESIAGLMKVREEYSSIKAGLEDREAKLLEFDFFRNKVAELKKAPPKDPERLPRNEAILAKWQGDYDVANTKCKQMLATTVEVGSRANKVAVTSFFSSYTMYLSEAASTSRIVLRDIGGTIAGVQQAALNVVTSAATTIASAIPTPTFTVPTVAPIIVPTPAVAPTPAPAPPAAAQPKDPFAFH